jgi:hypothetical protein
MSLELISNWWLTMARFLFVKISVVSRALVGLEKC